MKQSKSIEERISLATRQGGGNCPAYQHKALAQHPQATDGLQKAMMESIGPGHDIG